MTWWHRLRALPPWCLAALCVGLVRLPFLDLRLGADEGGFLAVGGQWHPGTSLYGDYWVDRPPLLIAVFALAAALGGTIALRLIGLAAAVAAVVLAGWLGRLVGGRAGSTVASVATAALVCTPWFDGLEISGELLALPLVLAGVGCVVSADLRSSTPGSRGGWDWRWAAAGALGAGAFLVKQGFLDVLVLGSVLLLLRRFSAHGKSRGDGILRSMLLFALGAAAVTVTAVAAAAWRGTTPAGLWDAVVVFRTQAAQVMADHGADATAERFERFPAVLVVSGVALLAAPAIFGVVLGRRNRPLTYAGLALLMWEAFVVVVGGSYWLHYLIGLVPGIALTAALMAHGAHLAVPRLERRDHGVAVTRRGVRAGLLVVVISSVLTVGFRLLVPPATAPSQVVGKWLADHRERDDTAVVAFGQPQILAESGTSSPYPQLWSLPVRVRDPHLRQLSKVLAGPRGPYWLLVWKKLETWGIDPTRAERVVARDYRQVADVCGYRVYLRNDVERRTGGQAPPCG